MSGTLVLAGALALRAQSPPPQATTVPTVVDFTRDIKPIFEKNCYECHGPTQGARPPAPPCRRVHPPGRRLRTGDRGRARRPEPADSPGHGAGRRRSDAARSRSAPAGGHRPAQGVDRSGRDTAGRGRDADRRRRERRGTLGLHQAEASGPAGRDQPRLGAEPDRSLRPRAARTRTAAPLGRGRQAHAPAPRDARSDRAAADAGPSSRRSWPIRHPTPTNGSSTGCWPRRTTASAGRAHGWIWRATPTPTATRRTTGGRSGNTVTG